MNKLDLVDVFPGHVWKTGPFTPQMCAFDVQKVAAVESARY
jgi:hypothetical protein